MRTSMLALKAGHAIGRSPRSARRCAVSRPSRVRSRGPAARRSTMEFERRTTVWVGPDEAFEFFADPANLPLYVPTVTFEEAIAVDGDPAAEPDVEAGAGGPQAHFLPDRKARR